LQISQFEEVQQSFQVQKKPEQKTDFLQQVQKLFGLFSSCHDMRKQENFRREKPDELHAGCCCMGGRGGPSSMQKQREFCQHNF
jgi:hypothetical protein